MGNSGKVQEDKRADGSRPWDALPWGGVGGNERGQVQPGKQNLNQKQVGSQESMPLRNGRVTIKENKMEKLLFLQCQPCFLRKKSKTSSRHSGKYQDSFAWVVGQKTVEAGKSHKYFEKLYCQGGKEPSKEGD